MATYISLIKWTREGIVSVREAGQRREMGKKAAEALGITWKGSYLTMGRADVVVIFEAPDDETATRFLLAAGSQGFFSTETMRAFSEAEADQIFGSIPEAPRG